MSELSVVIAKLSGIRKAVFALMNENVSRNRSAGKLKTRSNFPPDHVQRYFTQAAIHLDTLKALIPDFYGLLNADETSAAAILPMFYGQCYDLKPVAIR
jgi:hypothetical protein